MSEQVSSVEKLHGRHTEQGKQSVILCLFWNSAAIWREKVNNKIIQDWQYCKKAKILCQVSGKEDHF